MIKLVVLILTVAFSYVPHSQFILKKTTERHGKGSYRVLQEVVFQSNDDRVVVQETWHVADGTQMFLEARGPQISYVALYEGQNKSTLSTANKAATSRLPANFFEGFFHYRSVNDLARAILRAGITSNEILSPQRRARQLKDIEYKGQSFVRLSRTNGTIAYAFGTAVSGDSSQVPSLWIEQDTFRVRRLRFKSGSEIMADDYQLYSNGLEFPRTRTISSGDDKITIRTLSITSIKTNSPLKEMLNTKVKQGNSNAFGKSSLQDKVQRFYQDYR